MMEVLALLGIIIGMKIVLVGLLYFHFTPFRFIELAIPRDHRIIARSLEKLRTHETLIEEIGLPMEPGFIWGGTVYERGIYHLGTGAHLAKLEFRLKGPQGSVRVFLSARKYPEHDWKIYGLTVFELTSIYRLDLVDPSAPIEAT